MLLRQKTSALIFTVHPRETVLNWNVLFSSMSIETKAIFTKTISLTLTKGNF